LVVVSVHHHQKESHCLTREQLSLVVVSVHHHQKELHCLTREQLSLVVVSVHHHQKELHCLTREQLSSVVVSAHHQTREESVALSVSTQCVLAACQAVVVTGLVSPDRFPAASVSAPACPLSVYQQMAASIDHWVVD
jgi:hypothetical protein